MVTTETLLADYSEIVPDARRRRLLDAAMEAMSENALENVNMDRIASRAGVTRVTLYREFGNRGALFEAVAALRLMLFDEHFFSGVDYSLALPEIIEAYLIASIKISKSDPVSRRWAGGGMKFLVSGSLIHRVATATWRPILARCSVEDSPHSGVKTENVALWLIILQYSLGRMVVETECDAQEAPKLVRQFVSPAFRDWRFDEDPEEVGA